VADEVAVAAIMAAVGSLSSPRTGRSVMAPTGPVGLASTGLDDFQVQQQLCWHLISDSAGHHPLVLGVYRVPRLVSH